MTQIVPDTVYKWDRLDVMVMSVTDGGSATLEASLDGQVFQSVGVLPLPDGELFAQANLRYCSFRFTGVTGTVNVKPSVKPV